MLLACSGCFQHRIANENGYRLTENGSAPMLVPLGPQKIGRDKFQTSMVALPGGSARVEHRANRPCAIDGEIFSLRPASPTDNTRWIVRSPSLSGWETLAGEYDIDSQWRSFTRILVRMNEDGCFPSGLSAVEIRTAVAQRIPLPANQVPSFFYSGRGLASIDLAPGMEVRLQQILPTGKAVALRSKGSFQMWLANYQVIPRHGAGVRLKLTRKTQTGVKAGAAPEEKELFSLARRFAQAPELRLLLKGFTANRPASDAILIGAASESQLDSASGLILQRDPAACVDEPGVVCMSFSRDALSLLAAVWVDGRRESYPFGAPLGAVLRSIPQSQQANALQSARVFRQLSPGHYAEIEFPRTPRGASELLLLPGDRIQWTH